METMTHSQMRTDHSLSDVSCHAEPNLLSPVSLEGLRKCRNPFPPLLGGKARSIVVLH